MSEAEAIAKSTHGPVTLAWLRDDLAKLGIQPGMLLMVHTSLSQLGWVVGGAETVLTALRATVGAPGTLLLPAFTTANTDPARWRRPPVPAAWVPLIREQAPAFDPATWLTREMGAVSDAFLRRPGVLRSLHPAISWAAQGPLAEQVLAGHALDEGLGEASPLGACYALGGSVLSLGTVKTTVLHLAETRAVYPSKVYYPQGAALLVEGERRWVEYQALEGDDSDFEQLRLDYMSSQPAGRAWQAGQVGYGMARLFQVRPLIDFAVDWIERHRR